MKTAEKEFESMILHRLGFRVGDLVRYDLSHRPTLAKSWGIAETGFGIIMGACGGQGRYVKIKVTERQHTMALDAGDAQISVCNSYSRTAAP
tara:strand:+ start:1686 stop:1961 length:276 start_codon:yes stop_codon:yes gene_type:complete